MQLSGMRALVTGGGTGIGRSLALALAERGARVVVCGRRSAPLDEVAKQSPAIEAVAADVSRDDERLRLLHEVETRLGGIDLLFNNAAVNAPRDLASEGGAEAFEQEIQINLLAPVRLVELFLPLLRAAPAACIANVTTGLALIPMARAPGYCASKAALHSYTRSLRRQLADTNVHVLEAFPPRVDTPMLADRDEKKAPPEGVAEEILRGIERRREEVYIGESRGLYWGSRLAPGALEALINRL